MTKPKKPPTEYEMIRAEKKANPAIIDKMDQARAYAKDLYFRYYTLEIIAQMANVSYGAVKKWVYTGNKETKVRAGDRPWRDQRREMEEAKIKAIGEDKLPLITEITGLTMVALRDGLQEYIKRNEAPSLSELNQLSGILEKSYKFGALVTGNPTSITEVRPTKQIKNLDDVRTVIVEHPFFQESAKTNPPEIEDVES